MEVPENEDDGSRQKNQFEFFTARIQPFHYDISGAAGPADIVRLYEANPGRKTIRPDRFFEFI